jgi:RHS repeat-associated protein
MRSKQTLNVTPNGVLNRNKQQFNNQRKLAQLGHQLHRLAGQALCLLIILSLLATSAPAAPQSIVGAANEFAQDIRFGFISGGWLKKLSAQFGGTSHAASDNNQNEQIRNVRIVPGSITLQRGQTAVFAALAYNADNELLSGVDFKWTSRDAGRGRQPERLVAGKFRSLNPGTFKITAKARGQEAEVTVTVLTSSIYPAPSSSVQQNSAQVSNEENNQLQKTRSENNLTSGKKENQVESANFVAEPNWNPTNWASYDDPGNVVGRPPGKNFDYGAGSKNFLFGAPVVSLPGRGIDLSMGLTYNSRLWNKSDNEVTYDIDRGFPAPGWSLGFGKMLDMGARSMMVEPDGTRHDFDGTITTWGTTYSNFTGYTTDGTFINYNSGRGANGIAWGQAWLPDGTHLTYGAPADGAVYPTQIRDRNGNYISITYRNNQGPHIETVTDTLGRIVTFNYDQLGRLITIKAPRMRASGGLWTRTLVRLHYKTLQIATHGFDSSMSFAARNYTPYVIDAIYYPATNTGYWFNDADSYSSYGMITKVSERRAMTWAASGEEQGVVTAGVMTKESIYNYPLTVEDAQDRAPGIGLTDAPAYTKLTNVWDDGAGGTKSAQTTYQVNQTSSPRLTEIKQPHPTLPNTKLVTKQYSYNNATQYNGMIDKIETFVEGPSGAQAFKGRTQTFWEQTDAANNYKSPRPTKVETTDELNQTKKVEYGYGAKYNQITSLREYDYGGATLLRETKTAYINDSNYTGAVYAGYLWSGRHILNLVDYAEVWDGSGNRVSHIDYEYDGGTLADAPGVIQHDETHDPFAPDKCGYELRESDPDYNSPYCSFEGHHSYSSNCDGVVPEDYVCRPPYDTATTYRGNVTTVRAYAKAQNLTEPVVETGGYDKTGNRIWASSSCCERTSFQYASGTQYAYPESVTRGAADPNSPHRVTTSATYVYETGQVKSTTDANGRISNTNYNADTLRPTISYTPTAAYQSYFYDDAAMTVTEELREAAIGATPGILAGKRKQYLNGLGLPRREETFGTGGAADIVDVQYTKLGQVWKQSRPYRAGETPQWTEVFYDALGRVEQTTTPDGSLTQNFYNETTRPDSATALPGQILRSRDGWGRERWVRQDALGRLAETVEPNPTGNGSVLSAGTWQTKYSYDALNNLKKTDQAGQLREFGYDSLGRMTRQKLAEQSATLNETGDYVGSGGVWSEAFFYDTRSNLIRRTDARGVKTHYSYQTGGADDPLNRLQSVWYDLSGPRDQSQTIHGAYGVSYEYETTAGLDKTRIKRITTPGNTTEDFAYDAEGRLSDYTTTIQWRSATPMAVSYLYDTLSRVTEMRYPAQYGLSGSPRKVVNQTFDTASRLSTLTYNNQLHASELAFNAANQVTQMKVGAVGANQVTENNGYDGQTGLLSNQSVQRAGANLLSLSYDYRKDLTAASGSGTWKTGELRKITDNLNSNKNREYEYDPLGKLTKAKGGNNLWQQQYFYDRFGNRTHLYESGVAANGSAIPRDGHQVLSFDFPTNRINTAGFEYDAAGNQTRAYSPDGSQWLRYEYDAAGRLVIVKNDAGTPIQSFAYGSSNARLVAVNSQTSDLTYYAWADGQVAAEYFEPGFLGAVRWQKSYVFAGGRLLSTATNNGGNEMIEHHHSDRLGTRIVTNPNSGGYFEQATLPFGSALNAESSGATNNRYTSYDRSQQTGLDYAVNRTYDSGQNRFTQVDPLQMGSTNLANPQSLNLYAYVENDPVNFVDPDGLNECSAEFSYEQCGGNNEFWNNQNGLFGNNFAYYHQTYGGMSESVATGLRLHLERVSNSINGYGFITSQEYRARSASVILFHPSIGYWYAGGTVWSEDTEMGNFIREMQRRTAPMAQVSEGFMSGVTDGISDLLDQRDSRANRNTAAFAIGAGIGAVAAALLPGPGKVKALQLVTKSRTANRGLAIAERFLGKGYTEIASGVYRSADGSRQFRMTTSDILGTHGKIGPHYNFEILNSSGNVVKNYHMPIR